MKKFSFLLIGAFLLSTIAFTIADEKKETRALTGSTAWMPNYVDIINITWATLEIETWNVTEVETWSVAEVETWNVAEIETWSIAEVATWDTVESSEVADSIQISDAAKAKYNEEQIAAYEWAYNNGITTINDIETARLTDGLTRAELAKMMSQYLNKVLWKEPTTSEKANYADVNSSLGDLADFIETAYAYKIMWINADGTPLKYFNPNGNVTRAEYATVFSRVLYGDKYNKSEWNYYEDHIKALKEAGILSNDTPTIQEVRGWVMLMMYRSTNAKAESTTEESTVEESTGTVLKIANPASVYCEENGGTLKIETAEDGGQTWICMFNDGSYCEEWSYYRNECKQGDIIYNTVSDELTGALYTQEDLKAAEKVITEEGFGKMTVKVENLKLKYMGDEKANLELKYCQELDATVEECIVFESEFYIPEQDTQMAWAFEPNTTLTGYQWYLGRTKGGEWKILTAGY